MCSIKIHLAFLIGIIVHLFVALSPSYAEDESFKHVNANHAVEISNTRLFFITSKHGFIHRTQSKSPLWNKPPAEIRSSSKKTSASTVLVQSIPTREQDLRTLEGGLPGGKWVWLIVGGILGGIIGNFIRKNLEGKALGALMGAAALLGLGQYLFQSENFTLYVDNANDQNIILAIDLLPPIAISGHSQVGIIFKEGSHRVKVTKAADKSDLEHFNLQATNFSVQSKNTHSIYYIYNVAAKNSYKAHNVVYVPK